MIDQPTNAPGSTTVTQTIPHPRGGRWLQLVFALIAMVSISSPQYTWALFTTPIENETGIGLAALQFTFSLLIVLQTWLAPGQGWLVDRFGPRLLLSIGAILVGLSWVFASGVDSLIMLYLTYGAMGGIGTGIIYIGVIGLVVRWFPDKRGFVTGIAAAGYGMGAILTTLPIARMIDASGYRTTLVVFGIIQGVVGFAAAQGLKRPPTQQVGSASAVAQSTHSYSPRQMLRTGPFWVMFVMMALMSTSGLMVTAQVGEFAKDFGVAETVVLGMAALTLSLTLSRFTNGLSRPLFGWISDHIGREPTMLLAFGLEAVGVLVLLAFRENAVLFVILTGIVFLGWGEIFSLFPSTLTDIYGPVHATTNYGFLYIAQGVGSLLGGPAAAWLYLTTGSWNPVFILVAVIDAGVGLCAFFLLRPMNRRWAARDHALALGDGPGAPDLSRAPDQVPPQA